MQGTTAQQMGAAAQCYHGPEGTQHPGQPGRLPGEAAVKDALGAPAPSTALTLSRRFLNA